MKNVYVVVETDTEGTDRFFPNCYQSLVVAKDKVEKQIVKYAKELGGEKPLGQFFVKDSKNSWVTVDQFEYKYTITKLNVR